jgi:hypothetical protein
MDRLSMAERPLGRKNENIAYRQVRAFGKISRRSTSTETYEEQVDHPLDHIVRCTMTQATIRQNSYSLDQSTQGRRYSVTPC